MTEVGYLELKKYLRAGIERVEELRKQFPPSNRDNQLHIPSFEQNVGRLHLTKDQRDIRSDKLDLLQKIAWQEIDNDLAAELIRSYEYDKT